MEKLSSISLDNIRKKKLTYLLLHAYKNVPYYHNILGKAEVVVNGSANLENFNKIPILTKEIIRKEGSNLYAKDYQRRKPYKNTSGGSTGEPVCFLQDQDYSDWNIANKIYYKSFGGQDVGQKELRLWGSERDVIRGSEKLSDRL
jgi:phenylacetate-CoA ligase